MERSEVKRSEEHTSELQSLAYLVCRLLLEKTNRSTPRDPRGPSLPSARRPPPATASPAGGIIKRSPRSISSERAVQSRSFFFLREGGPPQFSPFPLSGPFRT